MLSPTLCRIGAVPDYNANYASNFEGYRIAWYSAWGGERRRERPRWERPRRWDDEEGRRAEGLR